MLKCCDPSGPSRWTPPFPRSLRAVVFGLACLAGLGAVLPVRAEIPPVLWAEVPGRTNPYPIWVSSEAAVTAEGEFDPDLFHRVDRRILRGLVENPVPLDPGDDPTCLKVTEYYQSWVNPPDRSTVAKALETSELVVHGRIVAKDQGFSGSAPGELFEAEVAQVLEGELAVQTVLFFVPRGRVRAGPWTFCKGDRRYARSPEVGDRVLLMIPRAPEPGERYLELTFPTSLLVIDDQGNLHLADRHAENGAVASLEELNQVVERTLRTRLAVPPTTDVFFVTEDS